ncbi:hypothetical protein [Haloarchaeobius sp. HRN-SO-5]|uniref:hypothetical protein n=1 Tax=Haloarchaeobius sp. HRN-SO-5 TaxID=3446118 RepID=UPI003EBB540A
MDVQWDRLASWKTGGLFAVILLAGLLTAYYADSLVSTVLVLVVTAAVLVVADYFQR